MKKIRRFFAGLGLVSVELIVILILFILASLAFFMVTEEIFKEKDNQFDIRVFELIRPFITESRTRIMWFITFFASPRFLFPANVALVLIFLFTKKQRWYTVKVPVVSLGSLTLMSSLKLLFARTRPLDPVFQAARGFSYPSGHAMSAMTFFGLLIYLVWDNTKSMPVRWLLTILLVIIIFLIGFSRVYLRVHYASDVIAGFSLGLIWLVLSLWSINKIESLTKKKIVPVVEVPKLNS
jgi:membrane-associated phospholipid phosphatase